jgi:hypothetical protein
VLLARRRLDEQAVALFAATERWPAAPYLIACARRERALCDERLDAPSLAAAEANGRALDLAAAKALARAAS